MSSVEEAATRHRFQCYCIVESGRVVFASQDFSASFGIVAGERKDPWSGVAVAGDVERVCAAVREAHATGREVSVSFTAKRSDGERPHAVATIARIDAYPERPLLIAIAEAEHGHTVRELTLLAFNDPLTGLCNRARLLDDLRAKLLRCRKHGGMLGLLLADLDGFKAINDAHGHGVGDQTLVRVARCMEDAVREGDIVARLGGDEFAVVLPRLAGIEDAALVAGRLLRGVRKSGWNDAAHALGVSVGVAVWPLHGDTIDELFSSADRAMYSAKRAGKNQYCMADETGDGSGVKPIHFFDWGSDRDLGVRDMDCDHREMAALINQLGEELKSGSDEKRLDACMTRLVALTTQHFAREEQSMDDCDYPRRDMHKAEHARLLDDLAGLGMRLDSRSMVLTMRYLQNWLCRHVDGSDRELAWAVLASQRGKRAHAPVAPERCVVRLLPAAHKK